MKTLFDKHKILFNYSSSIYDIQPVGTGGTMLTTVNVRYGFIDSESGQELSGSAVGQGTDKGDKGVYKAITGAIKYIYMKSFNIPTGDDPENEKKPVNRVAKKAAKEAVKDLGADNEIDF